MNEVTVVLCEGTHDIAFLTRVLYSYGLCNYDKKLSSLPLPFKNNFETILKEKIRFDETRFKNLHFPSTCPSTVMYHQLPENSKKFIFFHNLNGQDNFNSANEIISVYLDMQKSTVENGTHSFLESSVFSIRFLFFYDADDSTIEHKVEDINVRLNISVNLRHNQLIPYASNSKTNQYGCYIFHNTETLKGELEDIIFEVINENEIINKAKEFLINNALEEERTHKYSENLSGSRYTGSTQYNFKKSILSMVGQLQFSGDSNSVIIRDTDYIRKSILDHNTHCLAIWSLFSKQEI